MSQLLSNFKAETLLAETGILENVKKLKTSIVYKTSDETYAFEDYYHLLMQDAASIEKIELMSEIPPGGAQGYLVTLTQALQTVTDKIESVHTRALFFLGKIRSAIHNRNNVLATFSVWYQLAATDMLSSTNLKIPASTIKALAESEFNRLLGEQADTGLDGMVEAVEVLIDHLKNARKLAQEKYKVGTEQVNASMLKLPSNPGLNDSPSPYPLLQARYGKVKTEAEAKVRPRYDDEEDFEEEAIVTPPENPDYVEHRQVEQTAILGKVVDMVATVEDSEIAIVDAEGVDEAAAQWRENIPDVEEDSDEAESIEDEGHRTVVVDDPFLGEIKVGASYGNEGTQAKVTPVDSPTKVRDTQTAKSRPRYDDEEDDDTPVAAVTVTKEEATSEVTPPPTKPKRTRISFD